MDGELIDGIITSLVDEPWAWRVSGDGYTIHKKGTGLSIWVGTLGPSLYTPVEKGFSFFKKRKLKKAINQWKILKAEIELQTEE